MKVGLVFLFVKRYFGRSAFSFIFIIERE